MIGEIRQNFTETSASVGLILATALSFNIDLFICLLFFSEIVIRHCIYGNKQLENWRYCTGTTESRADMQYTEDCYFPVARRS